MEHKFTRKEAGVGPIFKKLFNKKKIILVYLGL